MTELEFEIEKAAKNLRTIRTLANNVLLGVYTLTDEPIIDCGKKVYCRRFLWDQVRVLTYVGQFDQIPRLPHPKK